jgi:hypothetical protein
VVVLSAHGVERFLAALPQWNQSIRVPITRVGPIILSVVLAWQLVIAAQYSARYSALVTYVPDRTGLLSYLIDQPTQYLSVATDMQFLDVLQSHHKNFWNLYYPYHPEDVPAIEPAYTLSADDLSDVATWVPVEFFDEWLLYRNTRPDASYATLGNASTDAPTPCRVHAEAGSIDLWCDTRRPEQLIVHEYAFPDWMVTIDGVPAPLIPGEFLSVELPAGAQVVSFRYRPWLVIGAAAIAAIAWCIGLALLLWTSMHPLMSRRLLRTSDAPTSV